MILSTAHTYFPGTDDVWFSLNGTTYQNNSLVTLEDIGKGGDALLCVTILTACFQYSALGNWYFPNTTRVPGKFSRSDFFRTRGHMVVRMHRRRGGEEGIYHCKIPDSMNFIQEIYIGVYTASSGE